MGGDVTFVQRWSVLGVWWVRDFSRSIILSCTCQTQRDPIPLVDSTISISPVLKRDEAESHDSAPHWPMQRQSARPQYLIHNALELARRKSLEGDADGGHTVARDWGGPAQA